MIASPGSNPLIYYGKKYQTYIAWYYYNLNMSLSKYILSMKILIFKIHKNSIKNVHIRIRDSHTESLYLTMNLKFTSKSILYVTTTI